MERREMSGVLKSKSFLADSAMERNFRINEPFVKYQNLQKYDFRTNKNSIIMRTILHTALSTRMKFHWSEQSVKL